jgi:hypothetical protein
MTVHTPPATKPENTTTSGVQAIRAARVTRVTRAASTAGVRVPDVGETTADVTTRAQRLAHPLSVHAIRQLATDHGVCVHPLAMRRTDLATGQTEVFDIRCGATREAKCPACARRAKRLREQQCRQGWHRDDEPLPAPEANPEQVALLTLRAHFEYARADCLAKAQWSHIGELDQAIADVDAMISASGLRGATAPPADHTAQVAAATTNAGMVSATVGDGVDQADADTGGDAPHGDVSSPGGGVGDLDPVVAGGEGGGGSRRVRSTRRRQDAIGLPRHSVEARTVGRTFTGRAGRLFRPSTFVTLTLPSYGRVRPDGSPVDPAVYDYRRAAWDAVHFPALLDRLWQNLRRAVGWNVQYFGTVEPQRRLAPHAHFAVRGAIPRAVLRQVIDATYHQVWWPHAAVVRYAPDDVQPVWDGDAGGYVDPHSGQALPTWEQALNTLDTDLDTDPGRGPEHVVRFGDQVNMQGVLAGTPLADKLIGYLSKYLTKSVAECHRATTDTAVEHQRRLWQELRYTPCSPRCVNWLAYGVQPKDARQAMSAGYCRAKVHQLDTLGLGGRRVLVSRQWSGKTLADHRYDQRAWVRALLKNTLNIDDELDDTTRAQVTAAREGGSPAPIAWELARPGDPDVPDLSRRLLRAISTSIRHREAIAAAKAAGPPGDASPDRPGGVRAGGGGDG